MDKIATLDYSSATTASGVPISEVILDIWQAHQQFLGRVGTISPLIPDHFVSSVFSDEGKIGRVESTIHARPDALKSHFECGLGGKQDDIFQEGNPLSPGKNSFTLFGRLLTKTFEVS